MGLNDSLLAWGYRQSPAVTSVGECWNRLTAGLTVAEIVAFGGANNYNKGLENLADVVVSGGLGISAFGSGPFGQ
jgi:hypothetical protein